MTDQRQQVVTMGLATAALVISIWGDWLKAHFRWGAAAKLRLDVDHELAPSQYHRGWIEDAGLITEATAWLKPNLDELGRLKVHFFRVKVTNDSSVAAKSVTVWVKRFECCDATSDKKALENVQPLRWSDFWRFRTDRERKAVTGSDTDVEFKTLPEHSSKYCDLCFFYDPAGPPRVGGFRRNWVYLAVRNLPSSSYAIDQTGKHKVHLQVGAENAKSFQCIAIIDVDWANPNEPVKVYSLRNRNRTSPEG